MGLLDGIPPKRGLLAHAADVLLGSKTLLYGSATVFAAGLLAAPLCFYWSFAYFTASKSPWWLDLLTDATFFGIFVGGGMLGLLGLGRLTAGAEQR